MNTTTQQEILTRQQFADRANIMKAMAHPSRLMVIDELSRGERCVCDLRTLVGHDVSTVSKHLNVLKKAGIVLEGEDESSPGRSLLDEEEEAETAGSSSYALYSTSELEELLNEAIQDEDYEKASIIRDELNKRGK